MKNILIEYERTIPSVTLFIRLMKKFENRYDCFLRIKRTFDLSTEDIDWCDCIISIRGTSPLSRRIAEKAVRAGKFYVLNMDDNLLELPQDYIWMPSRKKELSRILNLSNVVLSPSEVLAERLCMLSKLNRYALVDTIVPDDDICSAKPAKEEKIKVVYAAGRDHVELINKYIIPVMPEICKRYGNMISFNFVSVKPDLSKFEDQIEVNYYPTMPFEEYRDFMSSHNFDIGLSPLDSGGFAKYKYYNKFIEYSIFGVIGIYSDCAPYNYIVQNDVNGFLCDDNPISWFNAFTKAIEDEELRKSCISNAQKLLKEKFNGEYILNQLLDGIPELLSFDGRRKPFKDTLIFDKFRYITYRFFERLYIVISYTNRIGFIGMLKRTLEHIKIVRRQGRI